MEFGAVAAGKDDTIATGSRNGAVRTYPGLHAAKATTVLEPPHKSLKNPVLHIAISKDGEWTVAPY